MSEKDFSTVDEVVQTLESFQDVNEQNLNQHNLQVIKLTNLIFGLWCLFMLFYLTGSTLS